VKANARHSDFVKFPDVLDPIEPFGISTNSPKSKTISDEDVGGAYKPNASEKLRFGVIVSLA
jgi:hypothetical protein